MTEDLLSPGALNYPWVHEHSPNFLSDEEYYNELRPLQQLLATELLKRWDATLKSLDIPYFLHAGTLLGSVRNQGWIPWDDDVDVLIRRSDFDALLGARVDWPEGTQLISEGRFSVTPKFVHLCSELNGVEPIGMDVFVVEDLPDSAFQRRVYFTLLRLATLLEVSRKHHATVGLQAGAVKRAIWNALEKIPISTPRRTEWLRKARTMYQGIPGCDLFIVGHPRGLPDVIKRSWLAEPRLGEFEGAQYPIPGDSQAFLTKLYGPDYLQPPPIEKRRPHASNAVCVSLGGNDYCLVRGTVGV